MWCSAKYAKGLFVLNIWKLFQKLQLFCSTSDLCGCFRGFILILYTPHWNKLSKRPWYATCSRSQTTCEVQMPWQTCLLLSPQTQPPEHARSLFPVSAAPVSWGIGQRLWVFKDWLLKQIVSLLLCSTIWSKKKKRPLKVIHSHIMLGSGAHHLFIHYVKSVFCSRHKQHVHERTLERAVYCDILVYFVPPLLSLFFLFFHFLP